MSANRHVSFAIYYDQEALATERTLVKSGLTTTTANSASNT